MPVSKGDRGQGDADVSRQGPTKDQQITSIPICVSYNYCSPHIFNYVNNATISVCSALYDQCCVVFYQSVVNCTSSPILTQRHPVFSLSFSLFLDVHIPKIPLFPRYLSITIIFNYLDLKYYNSLVPIDVNFCSFRVIPCLF